MKARDPRKGTLSLVRSEFKQEAIRARTKAASAGGEDGQFDDDVDDEAALRVLTKMAKQRRDSMAEYARGGREDLVQKEQAELDVLQEFLPAAMSDGELRAIVEDIIAQTGASGMKEMGKVMGPAMKRAAGKADGNAIRAVVEELLTPIPASE
jgi:uncharacterized protein YqeY